MSPDAAPDLGRLRAQAAGLERWHRKWTFDLLNRIVAVLLIVGGSAVGLSAHSRRAMAAAAIISAGLAALACTLVLLRHLGVRRRLAADPATEVARLTANPGRHQSAFFAGGELGGARARAGERAPESDPDAPDAYGAMRDVDVWGQRSEASSDGVNRTEDPRRGPIE